MTESLSPRERVMLALDHQTTDRVPIAMVCSGINPPARRALEAYLQADRGLSVDEYLTPLIDVAGCGPAYVGPALAPGHDIWGVGRKEQSYGDGAYDEIEYYPLGQAKTVADLEDYPWPTTDLFDYSLIPAQIKAEREGLNRALIISNGNIYESSWYMRGFEQVFMDFVLNPELIHGIFRRVTDFYRAHFRKMLEAGAGEIDLAFTADDVAGQNGLLMSLPMWAEFLKPYHTELNATIHEFGAKILYHSDGSVTNAVSGLMEMGIDCLQACQFSADNMDPVFLKETYGDWLCFEGGVSVQTTLPFGTVEDVVQEVQDRVRVLAKDGGYICGPSHAIQAGTPPENVVAMFDTARDCPLP
ncbi:MAG TPA: uroporphyrinogen decarboxylase family protein [Armatimonadota bacterium]|jgi:uroporphyrinogen decarboxylase